MRVEEKRFSVLMVIYFVTDAGASASAGECVQCGCMYDQEESPMQCECDATKGSLRPFCWAFCLVCGGAIG